MQLLWLCFVFFCICSANCCSWNQSVSCGNRFPDMELKGGKNSDIPFINGVTGNHHLFGQRLNSCKIENNGLVVCNNGTLSFSVFGLEIKRNTSNYSGSYLLYYELNDLQNETIHDYDADKRDYAMCLLKAASISPTFCPTDLLLIVWREYIYCESDGESEQITAQLALLSDSIKTYAIFLYNGTNVVRDCYPSVVTGFKDGVPGHNQSFYHFPLPKYSNAKSVLETGNAGTKGVFIYRIDGNVPEPINDVRSCGCNITELETIANYGAMEIATGNGSQCWATYQCYTGYRLNGSYIVRHCNGFSWDPVGEISSPPTCEAIDLLVPYTGDYFDMVLRFDTFWRYHPTPTYTVKHMLLEQPPFSGKLRKLYIYKNGVVSFGKRMSFSSRNGGPPHISANGSLSFENAEVHFFVNPSNSQFSKRQDHIMNLLKLHVDGVDGFKLRNMVVITWSNVNETTCNKPIRFQIGLVSGDLEKRTCTYALMINNVGECNNGEIIYNINGGNKLQFVTPSMPLNGNNASVYRFP